MINNKRKLGNARWHYGFSNKLKKRKVIEKMKNDFMKKYKTKYITIS